DTFAAGSDWKLAAGGLLFVVSSSLLAFALFTLGTVALSAIRRFPLKTLGAVAAVGYVVVVAFPEAIGLPVPSQPMLQYGIALGLMGLMTISESVSRWSARRSIRQRSSAVQQARQQLAGLSPDRKLGAVYIGGSQLSGRALEPNQLTEMWTLLKNRMGSKDLQLLMQMNQIPDDAVLQRWFTQLRQREIASRVPLWNPAQVVVKGQPPTHQLSAEVCIEVNSPLERETLLRAWHVRRWVITMMGGKGEAYDTAVTLTDMALRFHSEGIGSRLNWFLIQNKYDDAEDNRPSQQDYTAGERGERERLAKLLTELAPGSTAHSLEGWTAMSWKSDAMTLMDLVWEAAPDLTSMLILDRNATVGDLDGLTDDVALALTDPDVTIITAGRGTTNTYWPIGRGSQMVEEGHRSQMRGLPAGYPLGTGWGNIMAALFWPTMRALADPSIPRLPLTGGMSRRHRFSLSSRQRGLVGFIPHAVGISEDTWAAVQTAHTGVALGRSVKFLHSQAMWHKMRESWSHSEWLSAFPRWSGGYLQLMHDPLMQRINELGPLSIFVRDVSANSGRFFLSAPLALFNILIMPVAIKFGFSPFVELILAFWLLGFIFNQILTGHGLLVYLEGAGFNRLTAWLGGAVGFGLQLGFPALAPYAPALLVGGFLVGGFVVGLGRWAATRFPDAILFGPQLVIHAFGQWIRQNLEFSISGAAKGDPKGVDMAWRTSMGLQELQKGEPGEPDEPAKPFTNFFNLRTIVWVGVASLVVNLWALASLDLLNVVLLLPSLLFSVSCIAGPFVMAVQPGRDIKGWYMLPRVGGWVAAVAYFTVLRALGEFSSVLMVGGLLILPLGMAVVALRHVRWLGPLGAWVNTALQRLPVETRWRRALSDFQRSVVVSTLTLAFLFFVPLPGIIPLTVGDSGVPLTLVQLGV
ncbi:MAG: hypothetical protein AAB289_08640, partial [Chloroflexota bacterium]